MRENLKSAKSSDLLTLHIYCLRVARYYTCNHSVCRSIVQTMFAVVVRQRSFQVPAMLKLKQCRARTLPHRSTAARTPACRGPDHDDARRRWQGNTSSFSKHPHVLFLAARSAVRSNVSGTHRPHASISDDRLSTRRLISQPYPPPTR